MFDPELYRSKAEVEAWKHRCPIEAFKARVREAGLITDAEIAAIEADTAQEIQDALAFAEAGSFEPVENLTRDVYAREQRVAKRVQA